jgi:hypothetical protein
LLIFTADVKEIVDVAVEYEDVVDIKVVVEVVDAGIISSLILKLHTSPLIFWPDPL